MTEGTITPEVQIKELQEALATETDRLQKLFAAYETQEKELVDAKAEIEVLEKEIIDREIEKESLESIIAEKDVRVRELEMKATKNSKRVEHLERLRQLQDETGGFTAFICWSFQPDNTEMDNLPSTGAFEYLKTQAVARLYLDNFHNIQSSWVTQGKEIGQLALLFGANDMGSLMIEENVVSAAGTVHHLTLEEMKSSISNLGWIPRRRNVFYELVDGDIDT